MNSKRKFLLLAIFMALCSCRNVLNQNETPLDLTTKNSVEQSTETGPPDFETVKSLVFSLRCTQCHQQYNSYQQVILELTAIQNSVKINRMPKVGGPLTDSQKNLLNAWILSGAPEKLGDISGPPPALQPLEASWDSINKNIITPKCLVCHNPQGQANFLDLSTRQKIWIARNRLFADEKKLVDFDLANESYLVQILKDEEEPMPPPWSNISRLNNQEIETIENWISLGMP